MAIKAQTADAAHRKISQRHHLLIVGYTKMLETKFNLKNLPPELCEIIYEYHKVSDNFDKYGQEISLSDRGRTVTCKNLSNYTAYGVERIPCSGNKNTYIWSIRVNLLEEGEPALCIGIVDAEQDRLQSPFHADNCALYALTVGNSAFGAYIERWSETAFGGETHYAQQISTGDIIRLTFDMKRGRMFYAVNNRNDTLAFEHLDRRQDLSYKLAVTMSGKQTSVTILDFACVYHAASDPNIVH